MRNNPSLLAAVLVAWLSGSGAFAAGPVGSGRLYGSVRARHGTALTKVLFSPGFASSLPKAQQDILGSLKKIDLRDPDSRQAVAPILHELAAGEAPAVFFEKFEKLDAPEQARLARLAFAQALRTMEDKAASLSLAAGIHKDEARLRETETGLSELDAVYALYLGEKAKKGVAAAKKEALAKLEALVLAKRDATVNEVAGDWQKGSAEGWGVSGERAPRYEDGSRRGEPLEHEALAPTGDRAYTPGASDRRDPRREEADRLAQELSRAADDAARFSLVRRMEELARRNSSRGSPDEAIHDVLVKSLLRSLWASRDLDYSRHAAGTLLRIARSTPFPAIRELVRRGLSEDRRLNDPESYRQALDQALERLERQSVPAPLKRPGDLESLRPVDQGRGPALWVQLVEGARRSPLPALANALFMGLFLSSAYMAGLPLLAAAMMGLGMLMATSRALWTRQGYANIFQLVLLGALFSTAFGLPMTAGTVAALAGLTLLWGSVAALSYRFDLPTAGWFVNWLALSWAGFALTGLPLGVHPFWALGFGLLIHLWTKARAG